MQFLYFISADQRLYISVDKIVSIQQAFPSPSQPYFPRRWTIRTTDGRSTTYDDVKGAGWINATDLVFHDKDDEDEDEDGDEEFMRQLNLIS